MSLLIRGGTIVTGANALGVNGTITALATSTVASTVVSNTIPKISFDIGRQWSMELNSNVQVVRFQQGAYITQENNNWNADFSVIYRTGQSSVEQVLAAIRAAGLHIKDISTEDPDLEDVFVSLTYAAE